MAEGIGGGIAKTMERFAEGLPGFALVATVVGMALPLVVTQAPAEVRESYPVVAVVLAYLGNVVGHYLDRLFQSVWGVTASPRFLRWRSIRDLDDARRTLAAEWQRPITGIYDKAVQMLRRTEAWERKVRWPLEFSKASRSLFVLDAIALLLKAASGAAVLQIDARILIVLAVVLLWSYVALRVKHVTILYAVAWSLEYSVRDRFLCIAQSVIPIRRVVLYASEPIDPQDFDRTSLLLLSLALMHVEVTILTTTPASGGPRPVTVHLDSVRRILELEPVQASGHERFTVQDPSGVLQADLLLAIETKQSPVELSYTTEALKIKSELAEHLNVGRRKPRCE